MFFVACGFVDGVVISIIILLAVVSKMFVVKYIINEYTFTVWRERERVYYHQSNNIKFMEIEHSIK